jgi:hypothetical protein
MQMLSKPLTVTLRARFVLSAQKYIPMATFLSAAAIDENVIT